MDTRAIASNRVTWVGVVLIVLTGLLNFHVPHFLIESPRATGPASSLLELVFLANFAGALAAAVGIAFRRRWGWLLGLLVAAVSVLLWVAQETVGLPGLPQSWLEPSRIVSLIVEGLYVALALARGYRPALGLAVALALLLGLAPGTTAHAADCRFVLGFAALHDRIPRVVGQCREDEHHDPTSGDGLQATTNGLLVWRKADNVTAFTNGYRTWIQGPAGLQERLNTERFPWEQPAAGVGYLEGRVSIGPLQPVEREGVPPPTPSPVLCTAQTLIVDAADGATEVARFSLQPDCSYRVSLPPGTYVVRYPSSGLPRALNLPATVQVTSGATTRLDVSLDTGIR